MAGYKAIQSRKVEQEQLCENRSEYKIVTDGRTNILTYQPTILPTDMARSSCMSVTKNMVNA